MYLSENKIRIKSWEIKIKSWEIKLKSQNKINKK